MVLEEELESQCPGLCEIVVHENTDRALRLPRQVGSDRDCLLESRHPDAPQSCRVESRHPRDENLAAMVAPMLDIDTGRYPGVVHTS